MSGIKSVAGVSALLLAAAASSRVGAPNRTARPLTVTRAGWPWPARFPLYHATVARHAIASDRFRVRAQGLGNVTGGGTDRAVSLTLNPRVADAILVGLHVLQMGARGKLKEADLWKRFGEDAPRATAKLIAADDIEMNPESSRMRDAGYVHKEDYLGERLQAGWIPDTRRYSWNDADGNTLVRAWWQKATPAEGLSLRRSYFFRLYRYLLAYAESAQEAYDPVFIDTDMGALAATNDDDIGVIELVSTTPRVCLEPVDLVPFGYLDELKPWMGRELWEITRRCKQGVSEDSASPMWRDNYARLDQVGDFALEDSGPTGPSESMVSMGAMAEVRAFDPHQLTVVRQVSMTDRLRGLGLWRKVCHPYFNARELEQQPGLWVRGRQ